MSDATVKQPGFVFTFPGVVDRVHDGDSVVAHVRWRAGEAEAHGENIRVEGINAIELNQRFGTEARDYLATLLPAGTQFTLVSRKREKYGRPMGRIVRFADGVDVGQAMLTRLASDGVTPLARPYSP